MHHHQKLSSSNCDSVANMPRLNSTYMGSQPHDKKKRWDTKSSVLTLVTCIVFQSGVKWPKWKDGTPCENHVNENGMEATYSIPAVVKPFSVWKGRTSPCAAAVKILNVFIIQELLSAPIPPVLLSGLWTWTVGLYKWPRPFAVLFG